MNNYLDYEVSKVLKNAEKEMLDLNHPYVGSEHLLLSLLKLDDINNITSKYGLTYEIFKKELIRVVGKSTIKSKVILYTPLLRLIISEYMDLNTKSIKSLLSLVLSNEDGIAISILDSLNIDYDEILLEIKNDSNSILNEIGVNLNDKITDKLIGREKELTELQEILLRKKKNNPILIGEAGVGKSAIVYELARRIKNNEVNNKLASYKIISIDMSSLLTNTKYRGEFETKLNNIINYIKNNKNIILFIDEIHTIVKSGGGEGSIDAANILKPYLALSDIKIIGATTVDEYEKFISKDKALSRRFQSILVKEPSIEETKNILLGVKDEYEKFYNIKIDNNTIDTIVKLSNKYIYTNHNPDKSLDILDSLLSKVYLKNDFYFKNKIDECLLKKDFKKALIYKNKLINKTITYDDIKEVVEYIGNIKIIDNNLLKKLKDKLISVSYNFDAIKLFNILKDNINNKVIGINFKGSSSLGKTYIIDLISETLNYNKIELDMKEYRSNISINKLIGTTQGYIGYEDRCILDKIKYYPYSLIVLDNIEYASSNVIDLFKSGIKKGYITNNKGDVINLNSSIIVSTSDNKHCCIGINNKEVEDKVFDYEIEFNELNKDSINKYLKNNNIIVNKKMLKSVNNFYQLKKIIDMGDITVL